MRTYHLGFDEWEKTACGEPTRSLSEFTDALSGDLDMINCEACLRVVRSTADGTIICRTWAPPTLNRRDGERSAKG